MAGRELEVYVVGDAHATEVPIQPAPDGDAVSLHAVSDGSVWFWDARGTMAYDLASGEVRHVAGLTGRDSVADVSAGRMLIQVTTPSTGSGGMSVLDTEVQGGSAPPQATNVRSGDLSPDGSHWFTEDSDQFAVFDSATGKRQDPAHPGFAFAAPYQWLDNDTMAVLALAETNDHNPMITLLTCHVSTNDCAVTASDVGNYTQVAIPVGQSLRDQ